MMFRTIKTGMAKGTIKGKLANLFSEQKNNQLFSADPFQVANRIVNTMYVRTPDIFEGRVGPSSMSVINSALFFVTSGVM